MIRLSPQGDILQALYPLGRSVKEILTMQDAKLELRNRRNNVSEDDYTLESKIPAEISTADLTFVLNECIKVSNYKIRRQWPACEREKLNLNLPPHSPFSLHVNQQIFIVSIPLYNPSLPLVR